MRTVTFARSSVRRAISSIALALLLAAALLVRVPSPATAASPLATPTAAPTPAAAATQASRSAINSIRRAKKDDPSQVSFARFAGRPAFRTGVRKGLGIKRGRLVLKEPTKKRGYRGRKYDVGIWTGPTVTPGFAFTQLVASWAATTPGDSWVEIKVRVTSGTQRSRWMVLGRWAAADKHVRRTSVEGQADALGRIDVDTWKATSSADSYQLQVKLMRRAGATSASPKVSFAGAMTSRVSAAVPAVSQPGVASGIVLDVPAYSQMTHRGEFPQYGGGGEAWCSPTSTAMVLAYYNRLPQQGAYAWVGQRPDPWVDEAARRTYDLTYAGTGNWPFNTAYAASRGLSAFVTRLRSLSEAESLIAAGIPVIASISFSSGALSGAPISSTAGHLLVIVGFTANGDVVVNDPAGSRNNAVRRTYNRAQFERAWLGGSGGISYVIHDATHPLPPSAGNW